MTKTIAEAILSPRAGGEIECECLVIGSGAGGSLSAKYLSQKGRDVLVMEEGPFWETKDEWLTTVSSFPKIWREGGLIPIFGRSKMLFAEGRCVGGSTMVNAGLINRVSEEIASDWAKNWKIEGLGPGTMERYQNITEELLGVQVIDDPRNLSGRFLKEGAEKLGFDGRNIPMAVSNTANGLVKNNMQRTFLREAAEAGVKILTDCKAERIFFERGRAKEVSAVCAASDGKKTKIKIKFDKLFISAGAIQTPLLLRRSGVKKNIGDSIQFHPTLKIVAEFNEPVEAYKYEMPAFQIKEFSPKVILGASMSAPPLIASGLAGNWNKNKASINSLKNMAVYYASIKSKAKGIVRNVPFSKNSYAVIYSLSDDDFKNLRFGLEKLLEVLFSAGARRLFPSLDGAGEIKNGQKTSEYLDYNFAPGKLNLISIHAFSSCPMGEDKNIAAVDSYGKLHDMENVYVNDASILPSSPGANPQGPLMAMVLRNFDKNFG